MVSSRHHRLIVKAALCAFLGVLTILVIAGRKNLERLMYLSDVKRGLIEENLQLVEKNTALRFERDELSDPRYLELVSRQSLGLVKADEIIYVVEESKPLRPDSK